MKILDYIFILIICVIGFYIPLSNPDLTNTQLLIKHWPLYLLISAICGFLIIRRSK